MKHSLSVLYKVKKRLVIFGKKLSIGYTLANNFSSFRLLWFSMLYFRDLLFLFPCRSSGVNIKKQENGQNVVVEEREKDHSSVRNVLAKVTKVLLKQFSVPETHSYTYAHDLCPLSTSLLFNSIVVSRKEENLL